MFIICHFSAVLEILFYLSSVQEIFLLVFFSIWSINFITSSGEQGMVDEAQKALEEAEALKKVFFE